MRGAYNLLAERRVHYVFSEFGPNMMKQKGHDPLAYLRLFNSLGYIVRTHNDSVVPPALFQQFIDRLGAQITDIVLHKSFPDSPFSKLHTTIFANVPAFSSAPSQLALPVTSISLSWQATGSNAGDQSSGTLGGVQADDRTDGSHGRGDQHSGLPFSLSMQWRAGRPAPAPGSWICCINVNVTLLTTMLLYVVLVYAVGDRAELGEFRTTS